MRWVLLLLVASTGCLVLPKTTETTTALERTSIPLRVGPVGPVTLAANVSRDGIDAVTTRARRCTSEVRQRYAHHRSTEAEVAGADLAGTGGDPRALILVAAVAAPLFVVSAAVTGIAVAASSSEDDEYVKRVGVFETDCPLEAPGVELEVTMASGAVVHGLTDEHGRLSIRVPADEPARGTIVMRAGDRTAQIAYRRVEGAPVGVPTAGEQRRASTDRADESVRAALRACGDALDVHGDIAAQLEIDRLGRVHASPDRGGEPFAGCVNEGIASVRFPLYQAQRLVFPARL